MTRRGNTDAHAVDELAESSGHVASAQGLSPGAVRDVELPHDAQALSTLARVDYSDAFLLETGRAGDKTGEQWARTILEDAPPATRTMLRRGWFALGVRLGSTDDPRLVLGWTLKRSSADSALLGARSLFGIEAELLVKREPDGVLAATLMKLNNPASRAFWAGFSFQHRRVVRHLLRQAGRTAA